MSQQEYPSIAEELHRKTLDAVSWLLTHYESGQINHFEYSIAIKALFIAVSGLVPQDVYELLSTEEPQGPKDGVVLYREADNTMRTIVPYDGKYILIENDRGGPIKAMSKRVMHVGTPEANQWIDKMVETHRKQGFEKIWPR